MKTQWYARIAETPPEEVESEEEWENQEDCDPGALEQGTNHGQSPSELSGSRNDENFQELFKELMKEDRGRPLIAAANR